MINLFRTVDCLSDVYQIYHQIRVTGNKKGIKYINIDFKTEYCLKNNKL